MWKKLSLSVISFICLLTVYVAVDTDFLLANSTTYNVGGNVTGRVNMAPNGISGSNIGMQKGDRISVGGHSWQLMQYRNDYKNYEGNGCIPSTTAVCNNPPISSWISASNESIGETALNLKLADYASGEFGILSKSSAHTMLLNLNTEIQSDARSSSMVAKRDFTKLIEYVKSINGTSLGFLVPRIQYGTFQDNTIVGNGPFMLSTDMTMDASIYPKKDLAFYLPYYVSASYHNIPNGGFMSHAAFLIQTDGTSYSTEQDPNDCAITASCKFNVRPFIHLNTNEVVFAVSQGNGSKLGVVSEPLLASVYSSLYADAAGSSMKVRLLNSNMTVSFKDIQNELNRPITKIVQDKSINILATANVGNDLSGNPYTLSALFFDQNGIFKYYIPVDITTNSESYSLNLTGIPAGRYQVALVNEAYSSGMSPTDSSSLSAAKSLEIVTPISDLSFQQTSNLEFNVNVNTADTVGMISSSNGAGTPVYTLVADPAHASDATKFEIGNDGKSVQVKGTSLDAGTYTFKIQAQDESGYPETPLEISTTVSVSKSEITDLAFDNPSQTKKSITNAQTSWNETATSTPSDGTKVSYHIDSGNLNLLSIDSDTGAITMKTTTGFGKVVIKATADDSSTSKDNFNPKSITKDIVIHQDVEGSFTPDNASSDPVIPTFSASDTNVKGDGVIGSIAGTQGTPDNLISGAISYTYTLKTELDHNYFVLSGSTLKVKSGLDLGVGSYMVTITVADTYGNKDVNVKINVGVAAAEKLDFFDDSNAIITSKGMSMPYDSNNIKVLAKGVDSTNSNPIIYSIEDGSLNIITVHPSSGALSIHGVGTTKVKATKAGMSGQAEAVQTMDVTITKGNQVDFKFVDFAGSDVQLPIKGDGSYEEYRDPNTNELVSYSKDGSFQLHTSGGKGSVTYALKDGSERDVITVNADGTIQLINATTKSKMNRVSVSATSIDAGGTYADKTIELVININQGEQTLSFTDQPIIISHGNNVSIMPRFNSQNISNKDGSVADTDIYLDQSTITYTNGTANVQVDSNDGVSLKSSYTGLTGVDGTIEAIKDGNRNYKQVKEIGTFHIMDPSENDFTISYPNEVTYGETFTFTPRGDSSSTNVAYQITAVHPTIADYNTTTKKASAKRIGEASFTIKRTADGEVEKEKTVKVKVKAKDLNIKVDDKERYVGEVNPEFTYEDFASQLISWNEIQDRIEPDDIKLTSTPLQTSPKGSYSITANTSDLNSKYPNYSFLFQSANLTILQDEIGEEFYTLQIDDGTQAPYDGSWINQNVLFASTHREYTSVSNDKITWNDRQLSITVEGSVSHEFWMKKSTGALSSGIQKTVKIDKQKPVLKKIEATSSNNVLEDILNKVTFGYFFKPKTMFTVYTDDANGDIEVSTTKSITYTIQKRQSDKSLLDIEDVNGTQSIDVENESVRIKIGDSSGVYQVCVTPIDYARNQGDKECRDVKLAYPGVNESSDDDELPDLNIDVNDDGLPDLNITKNPGDKKPWINIDTNGDGIADMNLDREGDRTPYLNTGMIMDWTCDKKVDFDNDGTLDYKTSTTVKGINNLDTDDDKLPDLNIDLNLDGLPELNINTDGKFDKPTINIDGDGDGSADINIDEKKDGKPDKSIVEIKEWKPEYNVMEDNREKYDTMIIENPEGKKELEDNDVIVEQPDGTFLPNYSLKVEVITTSIEQAVKDKVMSVTNGQVIKEVYSVELMRDGVHVQPDGRLKIKIPLPKKCIDPHLIIELADGSYRRISAEVMDNHLVYESDFLGKVIIVGNADVVSLPNDENTPNSGGSIQPTVKGEYINVSGANTGDTTSSMLYSIALFGSLLSVVYIYRKIRSN